jgi:hypothetical protein
VASRFSTDDPKQVWLQGHMLSMRAVVLSVESPVSLDNGYATEDLVALEEGRDVQGHPVR